MYESFIKTIRSDEARELNKNPKALSLYFLIAQRAKRTNCFSVDGLEVGEALIGDHATCGLTQSEYRTAKKNLKKYRLANFRTTNKGTIAKLTSTRIFDINIEEGDKRMTSKRQPEDNIVTTNKSKRTFNKEKNTSFGFEDFWREYPKKKSVGKARKAWARIRPDRDLLKKILLSLERAKKTEQWTKEEGKYIPHPDNWLIAESWEDEYQESHCASLINPELAEWRKENSRIK